MNPSNHFIYSTHRRLLRAESPSDSKPYNEDKYKMISVVLATFVMFDFIIISLLFVCKCFTRLHLSPDPPHHSNPDDHPTTPPKPPPSNHVEVLEAIPVYIYGTDPALPATSSSSSSSPASCSFEVENCPICLDEYVHGDCIRVLPRCKHTFHKDCVDQWLMVKSLHCPVCRDRTIEQNVELATTNCRNSTANPSSSMAFSLPTPLRISSTL